MLNSIQQIALKAILCRIRFNSSPEKLLLIEFDSATRLKIFVLSLIQQLALKAV